jgi:cysteine desulfurase
LHLSNKVIVIYFDNNATTQMDPRVSERICAEYQARRVNPSSQHGPGREARRVVEDSRDSLLGDVSARMQGMHSDTLVFTSGGTEANNLAIFGISNLRAGRVVVSSIEHPSVLAAGERLAAMGREVDYLPCDTSGRIDLSPLRDWVNRGEAIALVSVMLANNETGVIQPIEALVQICKPLGIPVHCDAVQGLGKIPLSFEALGVDAMSITAHKLHGPIGIGALVLRHGLKLEPMLYGGFQQLGVRPGTENPALASGFAAAVRFAREELSERRERMQERRNALERFLIERHPWACIHGQDAERLPHTTSIAFPGMDRQVLQLALDRSGVACGTGSACASGSSQPSHVLQAMGLSPEKIRGSIRLSLSHETSAQEVEEGSAKIAEVLQRLRQVSSW